MTKRWEVIDVLRHSRHDWLNHIQLIKGNIALNRFDRVNEVIENIIHQSEHESKLCQLGIPNIAGKLLTFNWENHNFKIEFEVHGTVTDLSMFAKELEHFLACLFERVEKSCCNHSDNHLIITIRLLDEERQFIFDFHGEFDEHSRLQNWMENEASLYDCMTVKESYVTNEEIVLTVLLAEGY